MTALIVRRILEAALALMVFSFLCFLIAEKIPFEGRIHMLHY